MSSTDHQTNMDETPENYGEAFPGLPSNQMNGKKAPGSARPTSSSTAPHIRSSNITQVFRIPLEERRYKNLDQPFSTDRSAQAQACQQISKAHDVHIETTLARDQSLTIVLNGKADAVMKAKRDVVAKLQTQVCMITL